MKKIKIILLIGISAILLIGCNKPDKPPQYYTVNFAGEGVDIEPQTVESGNHAVAPENPDRDCYCFDGWFTDKETFTDQWDFETNIVTKDITLFVKWKEAPEWIEYVKSEMYSQYIFPTEDNEGPDSLKIIVFHNSMVIAVGFQFSAPFGVWLPHMLTHSEVQNDTIRLYIIDNCTNTNSGSCWCRCLFYYTFDFLFEFSGCFNYYYIAEFIRPNSNGRIIGEGYIYD